MELPDVPALAHGIGTQSTDGGPRYPQVLATLSPEQLRGLGEEYLARTRIQRKAGRPYFIDKLPNNFLHIGFIHLMLPNARIIDARRHPLGCCFSAFKQHFARGQHFTYDLAELGAYYRSYVELMAHFDALLPGRVHRVFYEELVEKTEHEVRRLLGRVRQTDFAPQPGLSGLEALVDGVRAAGLPVTLRVDGPLDDLPAGLDLSAYRIVQEALTNAIKHAGASAAEVRVRRTADEVELEVIDDGRGPSGNGRGQGLIGMRERASLLGGEVEAGPKPGGGFRVRAKLPL